VSEATPICLSEDEREEYQRITRSGSTSIRLRERLCIVLLADEGLSNQEIAQHMPVSAHKAGRWRNRFVELGLSGLEKNLPRGSNHGGAKTKKQTQLRQAIIDKTMNKKELPEGATHWTTRTMAAAVGTNQSFVTRVWRDCGFKPHLIRQFKVSNDPNFLEKLEDVVGLYLNPPENAVVFSVDEKSSIQALDRTQPGLPLKRGQAGTMTHDYKRHGTSTLFAALNVFTGEVIGECKKRHRHQEFLSFLKSVEAQTPEGLDLHVIVDNYATHKHQKVKNWLKRNKRVTLHFIPTSSSWLNLVERFFGIITEKAIRRGVFCSVKDLEKKIIDFIQAYNNDPKPMVWTKTTDAIMAKVERAKKTLSNEQFV
jgi:transposase